MVKLAVNLFDSIVMEFADNGDLFQKICEHQKNNSFFSETEIWSIFIQVVRGLRSLHELQIMHRDLKSANVFLFKDSTAKLGDLNVSKVAKKGLNYTQTGTPYYASPEVWRDQPYDIKSDMWSLGCVLYEMITLKPPFRAEDMASLYKKVLKGMYFLIIDIGIYPKIPTTYSQDLAAMVKHLLHVSPHLRPNCGKSTLKIKRFLDKILSLPIVMNRIQKIFPESPNLETNDQNVLLTTIRIPKNILYLSDRLPKPSYSQEPNNDAKRNTTDDSLPYISAQKKQRQKNPSYIRMMGKNQYREILEDSSLEEDYHQKSNAGVILAKHKKSASKIKSKKPVNIQSLIQKEESKEEPAKNASQVNSPRKEQEEIIPRKEDSTKKNKKSKENLRPANISSILEDADKEGNKNDPYIKDSYIQQLVNRKNPIIIKPLSNIKKIADIYSGNYAQKILAIQKK